MTGSFIPPSETEIQNNIGLYTSEETKNNRLQLCESCENYSINDNFISCSKCMCSIGLLVTFEHENCPIEKW